MKLEKSKNIFITTYDREWPGPVGVLKNKLGFEIVQLHGKEYGNFPTRKQLLKKEMDYSWKLFRHLKEYNHSKMIVCSNYCALLLLLLRKLHILKCEQVLWYGVYLHNPKMFGIVRKYIHFALPKKNFRFRIVVFSRPEVKLYSDAFDMPESSFIYMPYGEWNPEHKEPETADKGYYFAGGYANRDYVSLAKLFQNKPWPLVIAASKANRDFVEYTQTHTLSKNITVYWDIPETEFNKLLNESHAMMLIMKYNTGASGQVLLLHALEAGKLIVASYTDVVDEYVQNERTGLILTEKTDEALAEVMAYIENPDNKKHLDELAKAGYAHYQSTFSYEAISKYLVDEILKSLEN